MLEKEDHIKAKDSTNLTKTVQKTLNTFNELKVDIIASENIKADQKSKEDIEIMNVLNSIDKMVNQPSVSEKEESEVTESDQSSHKERISPLEEFNTLFRHADCVRKSIKLKESHIV